MTTQVELNLAGAVEAKDCGQAEVEEHGQEFVGTMRDVALGIARTRGSVTSDDLRRYAAEHGLVPHHPNAWGAIFSKGWRSVGYTRSALVSNHARTIRVWALQEPD